AYLPSRRSSDLKRSLRFLTRLLGLQQRGTQVVQRLDLLFLARNQFVDVATQLLDLAFARQRTVGFAAARGAQPAVAQPLAITGDHRLRQRGPRQARARGRGIVGNEHLGQQTAQHQRTADPGRQRIRRRLERSVVLARRQQRQTTILQSAQRVDMAIRAFDQHAFKQWSEHVLDRHFPARLHAQLLAGARQLVQRLRLQPVQRGTLLLAQRGLLQRLQRRQPAARALHLLARLGQCRLLLLLLFGDLGDLRLALVDLAAQQLDALPFGFVLAPQVIQS